MNQLDIGNRWLLADKLASLQATEWTLFSLAMILVGARIAVHIRMRIKTLHLSDTFLVLATVSALGLLTCDTYTYKVGAMTTFFEPTVDVWKVILLLFCSQINLCTCHSISLLTAFAAVWSIRCDSRPTTSSTSESTCPSTAYWPHITASYLILHRILAGHSMRSLSSSYCPA